MSGQHIYAIVPAGGIGKRMKSQKPKQFETLKGEPLVIRTLKALAQCKKISKFIIPTVDLVFTRKIIKSYAPEIDALIINGGKTRQDSINNALQEIKDMPEAEKPEMILVHDAVRALVNTQTIETTIEAAQKVGGAIAASRVTDTLKLAHGVGDKQDYIKRNVSRENMWVAQTPQVYKTEIFIKAYDKAKEDHFEGTDSAGLIERIGEDVILVESPKSNIKITTPEDLELAEKLLEA